MPIRVIVADRRQLVREAAGALLADAADIEVVRSVCSVQDAADHAKHRDVVLIGQVPDPGLADTLACGIVLLAEHGRWDAVIQALRTARTSRAVRDVPTVALTPREVAVLIEVSTGKSALEIATTLNISARTVERHTQSAMAKLGVRSKAHAVARSLELRLLDSAV